MRVLALLAGVALIAGCADESVAGMAAPAQVLEVDALGDARGGPGRLGAGAEPPPGVDLRSVSVEVADGRLMVSFEATTELVRPSTEGWHSPELVRGWWWVRFWDDAQDEIPAYLLSVMIDPLRARPSPPMVMVCDTRAGFAGVFCTAGDNLLEPSDARVTTNGTGLTVSVPADVFEALDVPFQWASLVTLGRTPAMDSDWWDFVPDWPGGDRLQPATQATEDPDAGIPLTDDPYAPANSEPLQPGADQRVWFPDPPAGDD